MSPTCETMPIDELRAYEILWVACDDRQVVGKGRAIEAIRRACVPDRRILVQLIQAEIISCGGIKHRKLI